MSAELSNQNYPSIESQTFDPSVFWLDPREIAKVNDLINHTHLSTMSLGVETLPAEERGISDQIASILIDAEGSQAANLRRAIEVGYLYGRLISKKSLDRSQLDGELPEAKSPISVVGRFIESLKNASSDNDVHSLYGGYKLFAAVRASEVALARSDILAFSLGASQEHMKRQFNLHDKSVGSVDSMDTIRMQSLYYAGALAAALGTSGHVIQSKQPTEITRSMILSKSSVSLRLNFDGNKDLLSSLDHEMSHKLRFEFSRHFAAVTPFGFQIGPNKMTLPKYSSRERAILTERFQAEDIEAVFVEDKTSAGPDSLIGVAGYKNFTDIWLADRFNSKVIPVGILVRQLGCIASFNQTHPNSWQLRQLAGDIIGETPDQVAYSSTVHIKDENLGHPNMPRHLKLPKHPDSDI